MDEKKKKIIAVVAVVLVAVIAIVVAFAVNNKNNEQKTPDGVVVDKIEGLEDAEEIELQVDEDGNIVAVPNETQTTPESTTQRIDPVTNPNETETTTSAPVTPTPSAITSINFTYNKEKTRLYLSWDAIDADGYEVSFKDSTNDLVQWTTFDTSKSKIYFNVVDLIKNGANITFKVVAYNLDVNGNRVYGETYAQNHLVEYENVTVPERNVSVEIALPRIYQPTTLTVFVNDVEFEVRNLPLDEELSSQQHQEDRKEIVDIGAQENNVKVKVVLTNEAKTLEDEKLTSGDILFFNMRDKDIEVLPNVMD